MTTAPLFVLSGPTGTVVAEGIHTAYGTVDAARSALLSGWVPIIVGALPFDVARPCALRRPASYRVADALPQRLAGTLPAMRVAATVPSTAAHEDRVRQALKVIRDPTGGLRKVVLARYSGGGIVTDSQPADELAETTTKFRTILSALGVPT